MISKCQKCGALIHSASTCFHCGSTRMETIYNADDIHANVDEEYRMMVAALKDRRFSEALRLSDQVIEWMPRFSEMYWLRFLASHQCSSDVELICNGVDCAQDPNYCNAIAYATSEEYRVYKDVEDKIAKLKKQLEREIALYIYKKKEDTYLTELHQGLAKKVEEKRNGLFAEWQKLQKIEQDLAVIQMNCRLRAREYQDALDSAKIKAESIKLEANKRVDLSDAEVHSFRVRMGAVLQQSEQARQVLDDFKKQHPWVKEFAQLEKARDEQVEKIKAALAEMKRFEASLLDAIAAYEKIVATSKQLNSKLNNMQFNGIKSIVGDRVFTTALREVGIVV